MLFFLNKNYTLVFLTALSLACTILLLIEIVKHPFIRLKIVNATGVEIHELSISCSNGEIVHTINNFHINATVNVDISALRGAVGCAVTPISADGTMLTSSGDYYIFSHNEIVLR